MFKSYSLGMHEREVDLKKIKSQFQSLGAGGKRPSNYAHGFISVRSFTKPLAYYGSNRYIDLVLAPSAVWRACVSLTV